MKTGTPFDRHERAAVGFSGGKDSLAVTYLLRPYWDRITFYHVDAGDLLPEVREIVSMVEAMVPTFRRINTDAAAWSEVAGLPSDLVPTSSTQAGMAMGMSRQRIVDRMDCCAANLILPMHQRMLEDKVTLAIRGTKRADLPRLPAYSGDTTCGYELWLPLENWSHDEVFEYLRAVDAPICRVYQHQVNAPECATCTAWWSEGRAAYLSRYHPELFDKYQARLALVAAEVAPHWQTADEGDVLMAGFQLPIQAIPPQLLAEMARAAFRPPALMSGGGGGGGGMQMPQSQGFNVGQGMAGMGQGLGMLAGALNKPASIDDRTRAIDAEIADWSKYGTPQQPQAGGGMFDFLSGMKMPSFGGGGGVSPGFLGGGSSGFGG